MSNPFLRGLGQGVTFGFADELGSGFKYLQRRMPFGQGEPPESYRALLEEARRLDDEARDEAPVGFYGGEMAGSLAAPGGLYAGATRGVKSGAAMGAALSGLYGVGAGEGTEGKALEGALAAGFGGALGAAFPAGGRGLQALRRLMEERKLRRQMERQLQMVEGN